MKKVRDPKKPQIKSESIPEVSPGPLVEETDYYFNEAGFMVFTAAYLSRRGFCCESGCRHCPYGFKKS